METPSRTRRRKAASIRRFGLASGLAPLRRLSASPEAMRFGWIMASASQAKASARRDWRSRQVLGTRSAVGGGSGRCGASTRRGARAGRRHGRLVVDVAVEMGVLVGGDRIIHAIIIGLLFDAEIALVGYVVLAFALAAGVAVDVLSVVVAGIDGTPRIIPRRFGVERDFGLGQRKQGRRMHVGRARRLLDHFGTRILGARARQNAQARSDLLDPSLRQAAEEVFCRHIAEMRFGAEGVARDARDEPAIASPDRAREDGSEHLACDDA